MQINGRKYTIILLAAFLLIASGVFTRIKAQVSITKIDAVELWAGKEAEIVIRGKNFKEIRTIDSVRIGEWNVKFVPPKKFTSDKKISLKITLPVAIKEGVYDFLMDYTDTTFSKESLKSKIGNKVPRPEMEVYVDGDLTEKNSEIEFETVLSNETTLKKIFIKNMGYKALHLSSLSLSRGFTLNTIIGDPFPDNLELMRGNGLTLVVQFSSQSAGTFPGVISFRSNDKGQDNRYTLKLMAEVEALPEPEFEVTIDSMVFSQNDSALVEYDILSSGIAADKIMYIKNTGETEITLNRPDLPERISLFGDFPLVIPVGEIAQLTLQITPDTSGKPLGNILFNFSDRMKYPFIIRTVGKVIQDTTVTIADKPVAESTQEDDDSVIVANPITVANPEVISPAGDENPDEPIPPDFDWLPIILIGSGILVLSLIIFLIKAFVTKAAANATVVKETTAKTKTAKVPIAKGATTATADANEPTSATTTDVIEPIANELTSATDVSQIATAAGSSLAVASVFQFKPKIDHGSQIIKKSSPLKIDFELTLKPVVDFGLPQISHAEKSLILESAVSLKKLIRDRKKEKQLSRDDLKRIEGIGPKISGILYSSGINSFSQLAGTDINFIKQLLLDAKINIADPSTWPTQAQLAANNEWEKLQSLQDELKGGRVVK